jgi:GT2 family glycosyltransferase
MPEEYFLYYEEVAWARRRQELPLIICHDAVVQHHGGTAIGSGSPDRAASPVSSYFNFRNRMRFVAKHRPATLPVSYCFSLLKAGQTLLKGNLHSAIAAFRGMHGLPPSKQVRMRFDQQAQHFAFGSVAPVPAKPSSRSRKLPAKRDLGGGFRSCVASEGRSEFSADLSTCRDLVARQQEPG